LKVVCANNKSAAANFILNCQLLQTAHQIFPFHPSVEVFGRYITQPDGLFLERGTVFKEGVGLYGSAAWLGGRAEETLA
jgi:hypothetical protein